MRSENVYIVSGIRIATLSGANFIFKQLFRERLKKKHKTSDWV